MYFLYWVIILGIVFAIFYHAHRIMCKLLKIEGRKFFQSGIVNALHMKIYWITIAALVLSLLTIHFITDLFSVESATFSLILMSFLLVLIVLQIIMEWKYHENKKVYLVTLSQFTLIIIMLGVCSVIYFT